MTKEIVLNWQNLLEINTTPDAAEGAETWVQICLGFSNVAEALNEVLFQAAYLCGGGWGSTEVTGGQWTLTLTGVRYYGDAAQDYIFSDAVMYQWGKNRRTQFRVKRIKADGTVEQTITWQVTLANVTISGGDANQPAAITVAVHGNGAPDFTETTP